MAMTIASLAAPALWAEQPATPASYAGVTRPSEERNLAFSAPGVVREVRVKEGDKVTAGDILIKLDARLDQNQLDTLKIEANSNNKVEYAEKELAQRIVQLKRKEELAKENALSPSELEEAQLNKELADTRLKLSHEELETAKLKAAGQQIKVDLTELKTTIDGIVQKLSVREGEFADPQQSNQRAAAVVVKNNPLKVEVFLPTALAAHLTYGQELLVCYPDDPKNGHKAKITFFDPVADAGSGMRKLYLELRNDENRESGWQVSVQVPQ
jgi:macrolide-specific efflux system membrane fusion protein